MAKITRRRSRIETGAATTRQKIAPIGPRPARGWKNPRKARNQTATGRATKKSIKAIKPWTSAEVARPFSRFRKANPEPKGELEHLNPYTLLVAVVLSAQAT
jgi:endonuclease-3